MKKNNINNKFFFWLLVAGFCLFFTVSNSAAQIAPNSNTVPIPGFSYPVMTLTPYKPLARSLVTSQAWVATEVYKRFSISFNAVDDAELTGEMSVRFDIDNADIYPYPENFDYYYIHGEVWNDIKAYLTPLVRETDPKTDAQAIYTFTIPPYIWGIFKVVETVWAKDCGHDSFFVEIKRGNMRVPFGAYTPYGKKVFVKKAHNRFELNGKYDEWFDKDVCHWNAYYHPFERTRTCLYFLRPGNYKLIYSAREDLTRLSAIKIVRVFPTPSISLELSDEAALEVALDELEKYLGSHEAEYQYPESDLLMLEPVKDDLGIESERAFWLCYGYIKDTNGNDVKDAEITAYHTSLPDKGSDLSGSNGFYRISRQGPAWPEGHYRVCARKPGIGTAYGEFYYYHNQPYPRVDLVLKMSYSECVFAVDFMVDITD